MYHADGPRGYQGKEALGLGGGGAGTLDLCPRLERQRIDLDKAGAGLLVKRGVAIVGSQTVVVEAEGTLAADDMAVTLKELQADGAGNELLGIGHKGIERVLERAVPLAVIHGGGPILLELNLGLEQVALDANVLKRLVGGDECQGAGNLIALAALEAHQTILDQIETAKAVVAGNLVEGDDDLGELHLLAVDGDRLAGLKLNFSVGRGVGRVLGVLGHNPGVVERLVPGILQVAALDGATPKVVVDGVVRFMSMPPLHSSITWVAKAVYAFSILQSPASFIRRKNSVSANKK